jgi:hypothetical protein
MKPNAVVTEYVRKLSDESLGQIRLWFRQDLYGDKAAILNALQQDKDMDRWLLDACDRNEFFDKLDTIGECVQREYNRREVQDKETKRKK